MSQNEPRKKKRKYTKKTGRPSKLTPMALQKTDEMMSQDCTNVKLAKVLGVTVTTLQNWRSNSDEFLAVYEHAKLKAKQAVGSALFTRAVGYTYEKKRIETDQEGNERITTDIVVMPPDVSAQQFWLKNNDSENYKDKTEQHITGNLQPIVTETPEEQLQRVKDMLKDDIK